VLDCVVNRDYDIAQSTMSSLTCPEPLLTTIVRVTPELYKEILVITLAVRQLMRDSCIWARHLKLTHKIEENHHALLHTLRGSTLDVGAMRAVVRSFCEEQRPDISIARLEFVPAALGSPWAALPPPKFLGNCPGRNTIELNTS